MEEKNISSLLGRDREEKKGEPIGLLSRFFAFIVDFIVIVLIFSFFNFLYIWISDWSLQKLLSLSYGQAPTRLLWISNISFMVLVLCYFTVFESKWGGGASPGKRTLQIEVLDENSKPISPRLSFWRNLARLPWFLPLWLIPTGGFVFLLVDIGLIAFKKRRIGDLLAKTHVEIY